MKRGNKGTPFPASESIFLAQTYTGSRLICNIWILEVDWISYLWAYAVFCASLIFTSFLASSIFDTLFTLVYQRQLHCKSALHVGQRL